MGLGGLPLSFVPPHYFVCVSFLTPTTSFGHKISLETPFWHLAEHAAAARKRLTREPIPVLVAHSTNLSWGQAHSGLEGRRSPKPRRDPTDKSVLQTFKIKVVLGK